MTDKHKSVADALSAIADAVAGLRSETGLTEEAVVLLLSHHTKLGQRVIAKVLHGSVEALERYTEEAE